MSDAINPNLLDRMIEAVAPSYAARRYASRAALDTARQMSYRGAVGTRASTAWGTSTSYRGGSALDRMGLASMRDRARRVYRNSAIGRSLLNTETDEVVADGYSLQMRSSSPDFNKEAEDRWYNWLDGADVQGKASATELYRMSWREPRKDGDGGFILMRRGGYPYLQWIPGDWIGGGFTKVGDPTVIDGVECDPSGRPRVFHIRDVDANGGETATAIPAEDFVYLPHLDDPLAVRGVSVYSTIFNELDQLDEYKEAVVIAARMACIFGLIEKRKNPAAATASLGMTSSGGSESQKAVTLENGMMKVIGQDDSVFQVQAQQPMNQTPDFIRAMFRILCLPFDMPLEIGQKDLSQVNFSGGRIGLIGYHRACRVKQAWHKERCWNRIAFWWLSVERDRQRLGFSDAFRNPFPRDYGTFNLTGRTWELNDPEAENKADELAMKIGIKSIQMVCEERQIDFNEVVAQRVEADRILREKGLVATTA